MKKSIYREFAPAKINLALHVTRRRNDGYHELESLVAFAGIGDRLSATLSELSNVDALEITGPFGSTLAGDSDNLVLKAARAFRNEWPDNIPSGISFKLEKNLPIASGIGGGSADAAAALRILTQMSGLDISAKVLHEMALKLGADVPVCLAGKASFMRGIGEIITPISLPNHLYIVLVNPLISVSTAEIFAGLQYTENDGLPENKSLFQESEGLAQWLQSTRNDLMAPAVARVPVIEEIAGFLQTSDGCQFARMSGSGATVFGLFTSSEKAHGAAKKLKEKWPHFWVEAGLLISA